MSAHKQLTATATATATTTAIALLWLVAYGCDARVPAPAGGKGLASNQRREEQAVRNIRATELLKYMNLSVNPCHDFYDFACGNWAAGELPTLQSQLEQRVSKELQVILEDQLTPIDAGSAPKVKHFYQSCVAAPSSSPQQHNFLIDFVKRHGGLPTVPGTNWDAGFSWVQVVALLRANYGMELLIGLQIDTNQHTMRGNSIHLTEPRSTLLPAALCSAIAMRLASTQDAQYEQVQRQVVRDMQAWFSLRDAEANSFAAEVVRFEYELCKLMRHEHTLRTPDDEVEPAGQRGATHRTGQSRLTGNRQAAPLYARHRLQELTEQYGGVIDFQQYVDIIFATRINDQVYVRYEPYFEHLARVVRTSSKPTLANYIMYRALAHLNFPSNERPNKRPKHCVDLVMRYFPRVVGELYTRRHRREDVRSDVQHLYQDIANAFDESLKADWLEENARRAARQKLQPFKLAFPGNENLELSELQLDERMDYWRKLELVMRYNAKQELERLTNVEFGSSRDSVQAPDVRVQLVPADSQLLLGWGLLQPLYYHHYYAHALKYSLLGQRMASELVRAFDEQGWRQSPLSPMRWDDYTTEGFRNRSECFRSQFSNYLYNNPLQFRNASQLRDIMADSSGLNVAFAAYLAWLESMDPHSRGAMMRETLPDVNFTNTQLFFINFAQMRCVARHDEQPAPDFMPLQRHTEERYAINGPLSNNVEFAREFACAVGTEMNPADKCALY